MQQNQLEGLMIQMKEIRSQKTQQCFTQASLVTDLLYQQRFLLIKSQG